MRSCLLACATVFSLGAGAFAEVVHFTNPAPGQPGHYDWRLERTSGWESWLDITAPSTAQSSQASPGGVAQMYFFEPDSDPPSNRTAGGAAVNRTFFASWGVFATTAYSSGDLIGFSDFGFSNFATHAVEVEPASILTTFPEGARRYMGVKTGGGNYGWIEVERTGIGFAAFAWAYETQPGVPILAGQIPAPGAAALLALAAAGAVRRRNR